MVLKWVEGFEFFGIVNAFDSAKYTTFNGSQTGSVDAGRYFGKSFKNATFSFRPFDVKDEWTIGFAIKPSFIVSPTDIYGSYYIAFRKGGVEQFTLKFKRVTNQSFVYAILRGSTEIASGTKEIHHLEGWHYLEIYFKATNSGDLELRINGFPDIIISGEDLQADSSSGVDNVGFTLNGSYLDDMYLCEGKEFLGDQIVEGIEMNSDASPNQWSPGGTNPNSDHYKNIDPSNNRYLEEDTAGQKEVFGLAQEIQTHEELEGYQLDIFAELDAAGSEDMHIIDGSSFTITSTSWEHKSEIKTDSALPSTHGFEKD